MVVTGGGIFFFFGRRGERGDSWTELEAEDVERVAGGSLLRRRGLVGAFPREVVLGPRMSEVALEFSTGTHDGYDVNKAARAQ